MKISLEIVLLCVRQESSREKPHDKCAVVKTFSPSNSYKIRLEMLVRDKTGYISSFKGLMNFIIMTAILN